MRQVTIQRPITVPALATAMEGKPYQILEQLIYRGVFPSPTDAIDDSSALDVAGAFGVELKILEDDAPSE